MKIAAVTNDGRSISAHFGRARNYLVMTVENQAVISSEMRDKAACDHSHHHGHGHDHHDHHDQTGQAANLTMMDAAAPATQGGDSHADAVSLIADCEAVLSRGMGQGMHARLQSAGVRAVLTDIVLIEDAVAAYLAGQLQEHPELVH
jgi:predicted Fe-Mo cluster-binding NifX family protein